MLRLLAYHLGRRLGREFSLRGGTAVVLGRADDADIVTDWDHRISRRHATLLLDDGVVEVSQIPGSVNPVFVDGQESQSTRLRAGQSFVIGDTRFELQQTTQSDSPGNRQIQQLAIDRRTLQGVRYADADKRIDVLTSLPAVIRESGVERDLHMRLTHLLLAGIQNADAVAIVGLSKNGQPQVHHQERRFDLGQPLQPSLRLTSDALTQQNTILHVWGSESENELRYTQVAGFNWAFCTPFTDVQSEHAFYVTGRASTDGAPINEQPLHADIKFTEFIADIVGSLQRQRQLERQQAGLRQFFSPPVLQALGTDLDTSLLEPRECDVTVLFCDLRGFSHRAEEEAENLTGLLERVSMALEVMTSQILRFGGVTGDFQGDAALGFWGWPLATDEAPLNACRAALAIREAFGKAQEDPEHPLRDFETSIGIAHGRAVAGKIGTREQVKVTVFGPVVNLASRLEGMTRELHVPILVDEYLDQRIRESLPPEEGRVRRLLQVLPYGMDRSLVVSELVPPCSSDSVLTDQHLRDFESGVDCLIDGNWPQAWRYLHSMPADDRAQDYPSMLIAQHERKAPADWDGIVRIRKKSG